jgi:hypothetical protein
VVAQAAQVTTVRTLPALNLAAAPGSVAEVDLVSAVAAAPESVVSVAPAVSGILLAVAGASRMVRGQPVVRPAVAAIPSVVLLESEPQVVERGVSAAF